MDNCKLIADLLLPDIKITTEYYEKIYPERQLKDGAMVTRFAPSPTGFLHLGSIFGSLIDERLAHQTGGIFYLRIEDTDKKREVKGSIEDVVKGLKTYNIFFDEGSIDEKNEKGAYGPYTQSDRIDIYKCYVKALIERGLAYPCFCSNEDLNNLRKFQESIKVNTGYYGKFAKHRSIKLKEIEENLASGKEYVIRLKSQGTPDKRITFRDRIKGEISMPENIQDIVILKSDGLPTYHFAHAVDDHLMRTTLVVRGEEWLSSTPIHIQLFDMLGFKRVEYAHTSTLMKMDGTSKRKLSKRKDPELSFNYYDEQGYLPKAVIEYLLHIANSNFEDWRRENKKKAYTEFFVDIEKMSASGALFDLNKLMDISKEMVADMTAVEVYNSYIKWAEVYDEEMANLFKSDKDYGIKVFNIERESEKPRKDISKWTDVKKDLYFFFDELYDSYNKMFQFPEFMDKKAIKEILTKYKEFYDDNDDQEKWFNNLKKFGESLGYASKVKDFKKNKDKYKGHVGDVAMVIRIALTKSSITPDLYESIKLIGKSRFEKRLTEAADFLGGI